MEPGQTRAAEGSAPTSLAPRPGRGVRKVSPPGAAATALCWAPARPPTPRSMAAGQDAPGLPLRDGNASCATVFWLDGTTPQGRARSGQDWGLRPPAWPSGAHTGCVECTDQAPLVTRGPAGSSQAHQIPHTVPEMARHAPSACVDACSATFSFHPLSDFHIQSQFHGQQVKSYRRSNLYVPITGEWKAKPR